MWPHNKSRQGSSDIIKNNSFKNNFKLCYICAKAFQKAYYGNTYNQ